MYEDLQDGSYQSEKRKQGKKTAGKIVIFILFVLVWAAVSGIVVVLFFPRISESLVLSGAAEVFSDIKGARENASTYVSKLCFVKMNGDSYTYVLYPSRIHRTGESLYHDAIEALLDGPQTDAVSDGAVSFIPARTRLEGLTVSGSTAFVSLSSAFEKSDDGAGRQILETLRSVDERVSDVVVLVKGAEVQKIVGTYTEK